MPPWRRYPPDTPFNARACHSGVHVAVAWKTGAGHRQDASRPRAPAIRLGQQLAGRRWAAGDAFSFADCTTAPALFYADWAHPLPASRANVTACRQCLLARPSPSFARAIDEARPYRSYFPLGAPDRD